jgi:hypothetical protein
LNDLAKGREEVTESSKLEIAVLKCTIEIFEGRVEKYRETLDGTATGKLIATQTAKS